MRKSIIIMVALLLFIPGCETFFEFEDYIHIEGRVVKRIGDNHYPVQGAQIVTTRRSTLSDANGYFNLRNVPVPEDTYQVNVEIRANGFETVRETINISGIRTYSLDIIELQPVFEDMARASGQVRVGGVDSTASTTLNIETRVTEEDYSPGEVIISRREKTTDLKILNTIERANLEVVEVPEGMTVEEAITYFQAQPDILLAEPNYYVYTQSLPNDPKFKDQWNLKTINYPGAWFEVWDNDWNDIRIAAQDIWIGILDTGVNEHEDLDFSGNILFHRGENLFDPEQGEEPYDYTRPKGDSHGTHVTGIIGAATNNFKGIAGAAPGVRIVPWRVIGQSGATVDILINGIYAAIDEGVDIINMSLGTLNYHSFLHDAVIEAYNEGIILVGASGNDGEDGLRYPAAFPEVIAVGAIDQERRRASFSAIGPELELMAPGVNVMGPFYDTTYGTMSGTSMAAPQVSALAALIMGMDPSLSPEEVRFRMQSTAGNFYFPNDYVGYGAIDVFRALAPDMPNIKVFAGRESGEQIILKSEIAEVWGGEYMLYRVEPGNHRIYAWIDANGTGKIDEGDYFARSSVYSFPEGGERNIEILNLLYQWEDYFAALGVESLEIVEEE